MGQYVPDIGEECVISPQLQSKTKPVIYGLASPGRLCLMCDVSVLPWFNDSCCELEDKRQSR